MSIRNRRVPVEINQMKKTFKEHGILCFAKDESNFSELEALVPGPPDTPYENGVFRLSIQLSDAYPIHPPVVKFVNPVFHPNIDGAGNICLNILKTPPNGIYYPVVPLLSIFKSVQLLLSSPNADDPLQADAAEMFKNKNKEFLDKAKELTHKYSEKEIYDKMSKELS